MWLLDAFVFKFSAPAQFPSPNLQLQQSLTSFAEIVAFFGSDCTVGALKFQFATRIKEDVEILKNARAGGVDCKDVTLKSLAVKGGKGASG